MENQNELMHYGVLGMKWGHRKIAKAQSKMIDYRKNAIVGYNLSKRSAEIARESKNKGDKREYRQSKYAGAKTYEQSERYEKKANKLYNRLQKQGVTNNAYSSKIIEARTEAGKEYVKRSAGARAATFAGTTALSLGSVAVTRAAGLPVAFVYVSSGNKYKLKD